MRYKTEGMFVPGGVEQGRQLWQTVIQEAVEGRRSRQLGCKVHVVPKNTRKEQSECYTHQC